MIPKHRFATIFAQELYLNVESNEKALSALKALRIELEIFSSEVYKRSLSEVPSGALPLGIICGGPPRPWRIKGMERC